MPEQQVVMHRCKKIDSPITLEELNRSRKNHGRMIWIENGDGSRHEHIFDCDHRYRKEGGVVMPMSEFVALQKSRARARAREHLNRGAWWARSNFVHL